MTARDVVKVFCPRNHRVGTVRADADGLLLDYTAKVHHPTGIFGARAVDRLPDDAAMVLGGYCKACRKPVQVDVRQLREAAGSGRRGIAQPFGDAVDHEWRQAGRPPMYPPGATRGKGDPR